MTKNERRILDKVREVNEKGHLCGLGIGPEDQAFALPENRFIRRLSDEGKILFLSSKKRGAGWAVVELANRFVIEEKWDEMTGDAVEQILSAIRKDAVEQILSAIRKYHVERPNESFGTLIQKACGGSLPRDVDNDRFLKALQSMLATATQANLVKAQV